MNENSTVPETAPQCQSCFVTINSQDQFCQSCGFPLKGSPQDQQQFFEKRNYQHMEMHSLKKKISSAGVTLYVLAGFFILSGLLYFAFNSSADTASAVLITNAVVAVIFLLLGYGAEKKPVAAIISGMVLYILVVLMAFVEDPVSLFKNIIFKIIIVSYLIKGLVSALEAEKIKKQFNI